jgi:hypothetical protein
MLVGNKPDPPRISPIFNGFGNVLKFSIPLKQMLRRHSKKSIRHNSRLVCSKNPSERTGTHFTYFYWLLCELAIQTTGPINFMCLIKFTWLNLFTSISHWEFLVSRVKFIYVRELFSCLFWKYYFFVVYHTQLHRTDRLIVVILREDYSCAVSKRLSQLFLRDSFPFFFDYLFMRYVRCWLFAHAIRTTLSKIVANAKTIVLNYDTFPWGFLLVEKNCLLTVYSNQQIEA